MNKTERTRRDFFAAAAAGTLWGTAGSLLPAETSAKPLSNKTLYNGNSAAPRNREIRICFNFSALLKYNLSLETELDLAHQAGFRSVEIWQRRLDDYRQRGKNLADLRSWLIDHEMTVENSIGFLRCFSGNEQERKAALEQMRLDMENLSAIDCRCIAAPVLGPKAMEDNWETIEKLAGYYRDLLLLGEKTGVRPLFELWGHLKPICRLSRSAAVVLEARHANAALLLDAYHLYRGGNDYENLSLLSGSALPVFHANDFPGQPTFDQLKDADRVFPGDGVCPWPRLMKILRSIDFQGALSLEIFNPIYQKTMSPKQLVQKSFEKMQKILLM